MKLQTAVQLAIFVLAASIGIAVGQQPGTATPPAADREAAHKNVTPDEAARLLQEKKELVVIDVRTPEEFSAGHISGAKNVSLLEADFDQKIKSYEGKTLLLHCASGARSTRALKKMANLQFAEIYHMNGGMKAWQSAGKEVVKDTPKP